MLCPQFRLFAACSFLLFVLSSHAWSQCQTCGGSPGKGAAGCVECSTPPVHELGVLTSYYWNDPACCIDDPCLAPSCPPLVPARWYMLSEFVPLLRDQKDGGDFQRDATTGLSVLRESQFDPEFVAGTRFTLGRALGNWYRLEGIYLGSYDWEDSVTVTDDQTNSLGGIGNLVSPLSGFGDPAPVAGLDFNRLASISMASELQSAEINLRRRINLPYNKFGYGPGMYRGSGSLYVNRRAEASFLLGLRYVDLDDLFNYATQSDAPAGGTINQITTATSNNMIGLQIGLASQISAQPRGWIETEVKGGIYHNEVDLSSSFVSTTSAGGPVSSFADVDTLDQTSWLGELSVTYNYQFCGWLTCRVGYNALAALDVALGSQTFLDNTAFLQTGPIDAEANADVIFHGPSLGLIGTW
jgi:hypothetical protein